MRIPMQATVLTFAVGLAGCGGGGRILDRVAAVENQSARDHARIEESLRELRRAQHDYYARLDWLLRQGCARNAPPAAPLPGPPGAAPAGPTP
jgi:hypothetical protein